MKAVFIIGSSGSGKTTLSKTLSKAYKHFFGDTTVGTINLDCANSNSSTDIDIN